MYWDAYSILSCGRCDTDTCIDGDEGWGRLSAYSQIARDHGVALVDIPLHWIVRRFYGAIACSMLVGKRRVRNKIVAEIADSLLNALLLSCAGEVRYDITCTMHEVMKRAQPKYLEDGLWEKSPLGRLTKKIRTAEVRQRRTRIPHFDSAGIQRHVGAEIALNVPIHRSRNRAAKAKLLRTAFTLHPRLTGKVYALVGGYSWAFGADLAYQFAERKISPIHFVDTVLDIVHNGGSILDKVWGSTDSLSVALALKRKVSAETMALYAPRDVREAFGLPPTPVIPTAFANMELTNVPPKEHASWAAAYVAGAEERGGGMLSQKWPLKAPFTYWAEKDGITAMRDGIRDYMQRRYPVKTKLPRPHMSCSFCHGAVNVHH